MDDGVTPAELFFVREHHSAPQIAAPAWRLDVSGALLTHTELLRLPRVTLAATLECAENPTGGGMVSHGQWEGARLADVLSRAAQPAPPGATHLRCTGYDGFSRTIPLAKAIDASTLVVHRMNGDSLTASHGGPVRLLVPGWYGVASVKWLRTLQYAMGDSEDSGYRRKTRSLLAGVQTKDAVTAVAVKSAFARPVDGAVIGGRKFTIRGVAWAGERAVRSVEISTDDGATWAPATLASPPAPRFSWAHWHFAWKVPGPGVHALLARATDEGGKKQQLTRDSSRADEYEQNACQRIVVTVT